MTEQLLIIGDIAGRYNLLAAITKDVSPATSIISVGDAINKGPDSRLVLEFLINRPKSHLLIGNHELLLLRALEELDQSTSLAKLKYCNFWLESKGVPTLMSYCPGINIHKDPMAALISFKDTFESLGHRRYLQKCPFLFTSPGLVVTHSPAKMPWLLQTLKTYSIGDQQCFIGYDVHNQRYWLKADGKLINIESLELNFWEFVSCKEIPEPIPNYQHIFGHMRGWGYKKFGGKKKAFSNLCIDSKSKDKLNAIYWPTLERKKVNIST